ncbi:alpha/beta hydrolase [Galbibacter pacificus]|uniref:Alpha/beta fold hydrolase n=1 Tax=Galbibacter pacificus TaxID=2996052 RepID=A0ABT6FQ39_9FLAO|nr:alpha/beta fold hydrolase [Galbibacter pacificus]MDG3582133.1 alpha/beta fold hydrolase [Galbibacter pacificus]MDG3585391.1 alpha/beta fold hydrolase [Galbibacter pacificus]
MLQTKELSLYHIVKEPSVKKENPPVLFMFHGYGSNEDDLFSFASELPGELFVISVRAPFNLMPYGHAWYAIHFDAEDGKWSDDKQAVESRESISNFIDEAVKAYSLDKNNVTLLGFSQGSILSYAVALSYPEKIKNVIALSGYVNEKIIKEGYQNNNLSSLQFYCSHGAVDQVIPVEWARKTSPFLKGLDVKFIYEEYPVGHGVAPQNFYAFNNWLKERL